MPVPDFSPGEVLTAAAMDSIGLWLVKTQTVGTAVSTVTVTDAFSADYDNYKVTYFNGSASANVDLKVTLGGIVAGYYGGLFGVTFAANTPIGVGVNNQAAFLYCGTGTASYTAMDADIYSPFVSGKNTLISSSWVYNFGGFGYSTFRGELANSASVTSITIATSAGTLTGGTIRVYGYRN
jgi:hypothetical protein